VCAIPLVIGSWSYLNLGLSAVLRDLDLERYDFDSIATRATSGVTLSSAKSWGEEKLRTRKQDEADGQDCPVRIWAHSRDPSNSHVFRDVRRINEEIQQRTYSVTIDM